MSVAVALEQLAERVAEYGAIAFLTTVRDGTAHVVSIAVSFDGERFSIDVGKTSAGNIDTAKRATLLWPGTPYALIVDGDAAVENSGTAVLTPTRAVLHRVADAPSDLPSCVRLEP